MDIHKDIKSIRMFDIKKIKKLCKHLCFWYLFFPNILYHLNIVIIDCSAKVTEVTVSMHIRGTFEQGWNNGKPDQYHELWYKYVSFLYSILMKTYYYLYNYYDTFHKFGLFHAELFQMWWLFPKSYIIPNFISISFFEVDMVIVTLCGILNIKEVNLFIFIYYILLCVKKQKFNWVNLKI